MEYLNKRDIEFTFDKRNSLNTNIISYDEFAKLIDNEIEVLGSNK